MNTENWEEFLDKNPLARFSYYLNGRVWVLSEVQKEILDILDSSVIDNILIHERMSRAEMLFWLWTLGAYEVIRTMHQVKDCFAERIHLELFQLKKTLAIVRMPSAKMEKAGKKIPITSNRSASGFEFKTKDLIVGDPEDSKLARNLLTEFSCFIASLKKSDILTSHESSYDKES